jgi:hypothetical protein
MISSLLKNGMRKTPEMTLMSNLLKTMENGRHIDIVIASTDLFYIWHLKPYTKHQSNFFTGREISMLGIIVNSLNSELRYRLSFCFARHVNVIRQCEKNRDKHHEAPHRWPARPWRNDAQTGKTSERLPASVSQMESRHHGVETGRYHGY